MKTLVSVRLSSHTAAARSPMSPCNRGEIRPSTDGNIRSHSDGITAASRPRSTSSASAGSVPRRTARRPAARVDEARAAALGGVAQLLGLWQRLELLQRVVLDLADPLARDVERAADLLERPRPPAGQPEAHLDDLPLALRQRRQRASHVLAAQVLRRKLEWRHGVLVLDEVTQLGFLLLADRALERDRLLGHAQDVAHLARRALEV